MNINTKLRLFVCLIKHYGKKKPPFTSQDTKNNG